MLWAWRTAQNPKPEAVAAGCPASGWIHHGHPPWPVIVFDNWVDAELSCPYTATVAVYDGDEDTVPWADLISK